MISFEKVELGFLNEKNVGKGIVLVDRASGSWIAGKRIESNSAYEFGFQNQFCSFFARIYTYNEPFKFRFRNSKNKGFNRKIKTILLVV